MTTVRYEQKDGIATITLDRPESLNSMTNQFMDELRSALTAVEGDETVRVAILTGEGRGFCSGADLSGVDQSADPTRSGDASARGMDDHFNPAIRALAGIISAPRFI